MLRSAYDQKIMAILGPKQDYKKEIRKLRDHVLVNADIAIATFTIAVAGHGISERRLRSGLYDYCKISRLAFTRRKRS